MKKITPERTQTCTYEVKESDTGTGYYWDGWCEGDKAGDRLADNAPLTLKPEHFIGKTIVEIVPTCPFCGDLVEMAKDGEYYCDCENSRFARRA